MNENITISKNSYPNPSMDFDFLKAAGIEYIQKFSGKIWTDYNESDPGITMLEALCYAITELGYKTNIFNPKWMFQNVSSDQSSFTISEILKPNPVTIQDFRALLINQVPEVDYVWLKSNIEAGFVGLYDIDVLINNYKDIQRSETEILLDIKTVLSQHRNLCEDYENITFLTFDLVSVYAKIYINNDVTAEKIIAQIMVNLVKLFQFGVEKDNHAKETQQCRNNNSQQATTNISSFRVKKVMFDVKNIIDIKELLICQNNKAVKKEIIVNEGKRIALNMKDDSFKNYFKVYQGTYEVSVNYNQVNNYFNEIIKSEQLDEEINTNQSQHIDLKTAVDHAINNKETTISFSQKQLFQQYNSIQHDFPQIYGIGEYGLPKNVSEKRKIQVKQLKAYLLFFEQNMADYLKQLVKVQDLYSLQMLPYETYFTQIPTDIPFLSSILDEGLLDNMFSKTAEGTSTSEDLIKKFELFVQTLNFEFDHFFKRKNTFMNHLFARFGAIDVANNIDYYHEYIKEKKYETNSDLAPLADASNQLNNDVFHSSSLTSNNIIPGVLVPPFEKLEKKISYLKDYPNYSNNKNLGTVFLPAGKQVIDSILIKKLKFMLNIDMSKRSNLTNALYQFAQKYFPLKKIKNGKCTNQKLLEDDPTYQATLSDFMLYGGDAANYVIIQKHEEEEEIRHVYYQLKYKSPETLNTITINKRAVTRSKCYRIQAELIKKIQLIQKESRGLYAIENILLRDSNYNTDFSILDTDKIILKSINDDSLPNQGKIIDDILHYGQMSDNYITITVPENNDNEIEETAQSLSKLLGITLEEAIQNLKAQLDAKEETKYQLYLTRGSLNDQLAVYPDLLTENQIDETKEKLITFLQQFHSQDRNSLDVKYGSYMLDDMFSLRLSIVFPDWCTTFHGHDNQKFIKSQLLIPESPMNITIDFYYLSLEEMRRFEAAYNDWIIGRLNNLNPDGKAIISLFKDYKNKSS